MYDIEKLKPEELRVLATYILPHDYPETDLFDQMLIDLKPLGVRKLKGTIGALKGRFFSDRFLKSPYWQIISAHYRKQGVCPMCKQTKTLVVYSPAYHHLGVNHLHPEDVLLACGDCHHAMNQFARDYRFWKPMKAEEDFVIEQFLRLLRSKYS